MTEQEALSTADLLTKARKALETFHEVHVDDDGALTFRHVDVHAPTRQDDALAPGAPGLGNAQRGTL